MKPSTKRLLSALLVGAISFSVLTACGGKQNDASRAKAQSGNADEITVGVTSFADTLEPTQQYFSWVVSRYGVGETLVRFDEAGEIAPCLAESWSVSEDQLTWTFHIRQGVTFSNGDEMTPEMVKAALERVFEKSDRAATFFEPTAIAVEGQALKISTASPLAILPGSLADPLFLIVNTDVDDSTFETAGPICTGPYKVESFSPTQACVVVRNEHYWGGEVPLSRVTFQCIDDQTTRSMALQTGEIDIAYNLKTENTVEFENNANIQIQHLESLRSTFAFMNQNGVLSDLKLRQAVICALDKDTYCDVLLEGGATAGKSPVPPTLDFGFDELVDENAYNPERAKALLAEAGYVDVNGDGYVETPNGERLDLAFVIYTSREELNVFAQAAQANLKEVGIRMTLKTVSYETLLDLRDSGQFDLLIWNVLVANTGDPEKYLRENWYSTSSSNQAGYKNAEVDTLLDALASEFDEDARRALTIQIQQHIMDDAATVFFGYETTYLFSKTNLSGITMFPMDYYWLTSEVKYNA